MKDYPAFPQPMLQSSHDGTMAFPGEYGPFGGLTIRAYMATKFAAAQTATGRSLWSSDDQKEIAKFSVELADALIAELSK